MAETQSYTKKALEITVSLGRGAFSGGGSVLKARGLPVTAHIEKPGLPDSNRASVSLHGLSLEHMEQMTTLAWDPLEYRRNTISIAAGNEGEELSTVFIGNITSAFADFSGAPDVVMKIEAATSLWGRLLPASPKAVTGQVSLEDFCRQQAEEAGLNFRNDGVTASLSNAVFNGSPVEKAVAAARQTGAELIIDDDAMILASRSGARSGAAVLLSPETGMIGYPAFHSEGISVRSLFNPNLRYWGLVEVKSAVPKAGGLWRINKVTHQLTAYDPDGGPWETSVEAMQGYGRHRYQ